MKLENSKHTLTPNEINKFLYCPYQWYYERLYGKKTLSLLAKERNKKLGRYDTRQSLFNKGNEHHRSIVFYHSSLKKAAAFILIIIAAIMLIKVVKVV